MKHIEIKFKLSKKQGKDLFFIQTTGTYDKESAREVLIYLERRLASTDTKALEELNKERMCPTCRSVYATFIPYDGTKGGFYECLRCHECFSLEGNPQPNEQIN